MVKIGWATFTFIAFVSWVGSAEASGSWSKRTTTGPRPSERSVPSVAAAGTNIYLFGGVMDDFATGIDSFYDDLYRFDTTTDTWTELAPAGDKPHARSFGASAEHGGNMYIFGGAHYGPFFSDLIAFDDLWRYSPATNTWTLVQATNAGPFGRAGAAMWTHGNKIYIFGGVDAFFSVHNDLWSFDVATSTWTEVITDGAAGSPPPRHIAQHAPVTKHKKATIYGGEHIDPFTFAFTILADTWQFDHQTNTWADVTPVPARDLDPARNYGAAGIIGNYLVLQGGDLPGGDEGCGSPFPQNATEEVWAFHLSLKRWIQFSPSGDPLARIKRTSAAVVGSSMYIFSGWDFQCPGGVGPGQIWNLDTWSFSH